MLHVKWDVLIAWNIISHKLKSGNIEIDQICHSDNNITYNY